MHLYRKEKEGFEGNLIQIYLSESNCFSNAKLTDTCVVFILTVQLYNYYYQEINFKNV